jgi:predicted secreted protein
MIEINHTMNGHEVEVALGETFTIHLPENPTTGHRWRIVSSGAPTVQVEEDAPHHSGTSVAGAGGTHHWRFRTTQVGTAHLELEYCRSWEKKPAESFRVCVHVKEPRT